MWQLGPTSPDGSRPLQRRSCSPRRRPYHDATDCEPSSSIDVNGRTPCSLWDRAPARWNSQEQGQMQHKQMQRTIEELLHEKRDVAMQIRALNAKVAALERTTPSLGPYEKPARIGRVQYATPPGRAEKPARIGRVRYATPPGRVGVYHDLDERMPPLEATSHGYQAPTRRAAAYLAPDSRTSSRAHTTPYGYRPYE